jgi:hypothetical protein
MLFKSVFLPRNRRQQQQQKIREYSINYILGKTFLPRLILGGIRTTTATSGGFALTFLSPSMDLCGCTQEKFREQVFFLNK